MKGKTLALLGLALTASFASAATITTQVSFGTDIDSFDGYGVAGNIVFLLDMGTILPGYSNYALSGVGWNVTITAESPSFLSEATLAFNNSTNDSPDEVWLSPGLADINPGTMAYSSFVNFASIPLNNIALNGDNQLRLEFFEDFDDVPGVRDGFWHQGGTIDLQFEASPVPEPFTLLLAGGALAAAVRRRRR